MYNTSFHHSYILIILSLIALSMITSTPSTRSITALLSNNVVTSMSNNSTNITIYHINTTIHALIHTCKFFEKRVFIDLFNNTGYLLMMSIKDQLVYDAGVKIIECINGWIRSYMKNISSRYNLTPTSGSYIATILPGKIYSEIKSINESISKHVKHVEVLITNDNSVIVAFLTDETIYGNTISEKILLDAMNISVRKYDLSLKAIIIALINSIIPNCTRKGNIDRIYQKYSGLFAEKDLVVVGYGSVRICPIIELYTVLDGYRVNKSIPQLIFNKYRELFRNFTLEMYNECIPFVVFELIVLRNVKPLTIPPSTTSPNPVSTTIIRCNNTYTPIPFSWSYDIRYYNTTDSRDKYNNVLYYGIAFSAITVITGITILLVKKHERY